MRIPLPFAYVALTLSHVSLSLPHICLALPYGLQRYIIASMRLEWLVLAQNQIDNASRLQAGGPNDWMDDKAARTNQVESPSFDLGVYRILAEVILDDEL